MRVILFIVTSKEVWVKKEQYIMDEMQDTEKNTKADESIVAAEEPQTVSGASDEAAKEEGVILLRPGTMVFRGIAGAYLLYLAYNLLKGFGTAGSGEKWMIVIAAVIFLAVALWLLITTGKKLLYGEYKGGAKDPDAGK